MATSFFKAQALGNLGGAPELKYSASGSPRLTFSVAASNRIKNRDNEWEDATTWVRVTVFGKQADFLSERLSKGVKVLAEGRVNVRSYEGKNGAGFSVDMVASDVTILDKVERRAAADEVDEDDELPI